MAEPLGNNHKIRLASSTAIVRCITSFSGKPIKDWLPTGHPARTGQIVVPDTNNTIRKLDVARDHLTNDNLASLVAACGPCHCLDGWGYLSCSVSALVARNGHSAKHFAYYAQLRAAMSILAISGIGIFNGLNVCIDANSRVHKLEGDREQQSGLPTHSIVWPALEFWAKVDSNAEALLTSVTLHGTNLFEAVTSIWPSRQPASIVTPLINVWAFDLETANRHRDQRNISSYSPHDLNDLPCSFRDEMDFVADTWDALEPLITNSFPRIDQHLLRRIIQSLHTQDVDKIELADSAVSERYDELEPTLKTAVTLRFLLDEEGIGQPNLFELANNRKTTPRSMISRAILLLRAASALNSKALDDAGFSQERTEIRPWLEPLIEHRGIAAIGTPPEQMVNLWDETKSAVEDFRRTLDEKNYDVNRFFGTSDNGIPSITQFERAATWGLCP